MTNENKARLEAVVARYFQSVAQRKAASDVAMSGHMPPDTRPTCCEDGCTEPALDGNRRCHAHYIDAVL